MTSWYELILINFDIFYRWPDLLARATLNFRWNCPQLLRKMRFFPVSIYSHIYYLVFMQYIHNICILFHVYSFQAWFNGWYVSSLTISREPVCLVARAVRTNHQWLERRLNLMDLLHFYYEWEGQWTHPAYWAGSSSDVWSKGNNLNAWCSSCDGLQICGFALFATRHIQMTKVVH